MCLTRPTRIIDSSCVTPTSSFIIALLPTDKASRARRGTSIHTPLMTGQSGK